MPAFDFQAEHGLPVAHCIAGDREMLDDLRSVAEEMDAAPRLSTSRSIRAAGTPPASNAVAVMTFANITREPADDWIGTGMAETVSSDLKNIHGLTVIGRARVYDAEGADELVFLDITASSSSRETTYDVVRRTAEQVFIPLTVGGGVRSVADVRRLLNAGADKVSFNSAAVADPQVIRDASAKYGAQCIVVAIDAKRVKRGGGGQRQAARPGPPLVEVPVGGTVVGHDRSDRRPRAARRGREERNRRAARVRGGGADIEATLQCRGNHPGGRGQQGDRAAPARSRPRRRVGASGHGCQGTGALGVVTLSALSGRRCRPTSP